jgi:alpha-tubulin suppressor-like RCC1 family protein
VRPLIAVVAAVSLGLASSTAAAESGVKLVSETLAAGFSHTCAIVSTGVQCAGENSYGELGDGTVAQNTFDATPNPVDVAGLAGKPKAVAAGLGHTCALSTAGELSCWGENYYGQLGTGDRTDSPTPKTVIGAVKSIELGNSHSCAVTTGGAAMCWGLNEYGEIGNGEPGCEDKCFSTRPAAVAGLSDVRQLALGAHFSCAVTKEGDVSCWGQGFGPRPAVMPGLGSDVFAISAGIGHVCALTGDGAVKCWGDDEFGQLGDGKHGVGRASARPVTALEDGALAIAAGGDHTCAVTSSGAVGCWGRNDYGELGDGTTKDRDEIVGVNGLGRRSGVTEISVGYQFSCATFDGDEIKCWGKNDVGQLGDGTTDARHAPARTNFGGPSVSFLVRAQRHQAFKGKGYRFETTTVTGFGTLWLDPPPGEMFGPAASGTGSIRVHRWRIFEQGSVDEDDFTVEVVGPPASFDLFDSGDKITSMRVQVTKSDPAAKDDCARGREGTIELTDGIKSDKDFASIDVCGIRLRFRRHKGKGVIMKATVAMATHTRPAAS